MEKSQELLGVDVGGVIMDKSNDESDTSFFADNYLATTATDGAFEALRRLHARFDGRVVVVSKCGKKIESRTREWMRHHRFHDRTGIGEDRLHFCLKRHEKAPICARLGVTHFVDDKLEVLGYLDATVRRRYLFRPEEREVRRFAAHLPGVTTVSGWAEVLADLGA